MTSVFEDRTQLVTDVAIKGPCRVATTANITLSGLQTVDGVVLVANDRVLVKNQTSGVDNGIYLVSTSSWTRASDFQSNRAAVDGTLVFVRSGSANALSIFELSCATSPANIGTTSLTFNLVSVVVGNAGAFTTISASGQITSSLAIGTAPFVITSTTKVTNLNVDLLDGADWAAPLAIGTTTPAAVTATQLTISTAAGKIVPGADLAINQEPRRLPGQSKSYRRRAGLLPSRHHYHRRQCFADCRRERALPEQLQQPQQHQ